MLLREPICYGDSLAKASPPEKNLTTESSVTDAVPVSNLARNYALGILVVVYTFNFIDRQILAILLPAIKTEFVIDDWVLGFLTGPAFAIFYTIMGIPIATLADRYSRRNIIAIAVAAWSAMTALSGMATNVVQLSLARIGVGIGEAGCSPPAHSMIADYFPPATRSTAMGIYTLGISLGIMFAYFLGGLVAQTYGWRMALLMVAAPGIVLALLMWLTVKEPPRGMSDSQSDSGQRPKVIVVAKYLLRRRSFLHLAIGTGLASLGGYATATFFPSFLSRSYGMPISEVGIYLGLLYGIGGGLGFAGGGYVADKLGKTSRKRSLYGVAVALMVGWLFSFPVYLIYDANVNLLFAIVPTVLTNTYLATSFAMVQGMVEVRMRAVASAILLFVLNIIGLAMGPLIVGFVSDALVPLVGEESIRYALLIVGGIVIPWCAMHYIFAGRHIENDLARVGEK